MHCQGLFHKKINFFLHFFSQYIFTPFCQQGDRAERTVKNKCFFVEMTDEYLFFA